jgi:hypothetical protein
MFILPAQAWIMLGVVLLGWYRATHVDGLFEYEPASEFES